MDPSSLLAIIARKLRIWGESPIRNDFPDAVRSLLDRMDGRARANLLDDIRVVAAECGFAATVKAVGTVIDIGRTIDRAAIATCARRVLEGKGSSGGQDLKHHDKYMEDGHEHTRRPAAQARRRSGRQGHARTGHDLGAQPAVDAQRAREGRRERDPGPARLPRQPVRGRERQPGRIQTAAAARTGRLPLEQDPGRLRPGAWPRSPADRGRGQLEGLESVERAEDLVLYGDVGRGKTHLAIAIGVLACQRMIPVRFLAASSLVMRLRKARDENRLDQEPKAIGGAGLVIIDELGHLPIDIDGAGLLFQAGADGYGTRGVVSASNLGSGGWGDVFGDGDMAAAVIDRIVHHGGIIRFHGESYRNRHSLMK